MSVWFAQIGQFPRNEQMEFPFPIIKYSDKHEDIPYSLVPRLILETILRLIWNITFKQ